LHLTTVAYYREGGDKAEAIRDFMRILSVSHTVVPEGDLTDPAKIKYQAESPDEGALSQFAKAIGWYFFLNLFLVPG